MVISLFWSVICFLSGVTFVHASPGVVSHKNKPVYGTLQEGSAEGLELYFSFSVYVCILSFFNIINQYMDY